MGLTDLLNHVLNWLAPAFGVAVLVPLLSRLAMKGHRAASWPGAQFAVNFAVNLLALGFGLWFFGHDGKMATYAGMALASATTQWVMLRGWQA